MIKFGRDRKTLVIIAGIFDGKMVFEFECKTEAPTEVDAELRMKALRKEFDSSLQRRATDRARRLFIKWKKEGMPKND